MQTARAPIEKLRGEIEFKRAGLQPADPDPPNFAAAIEHAEIRAYFKSLTPAERTALAMNTTDLRLLEPLVRTPPELSGFDGNQRDTIKDIENRYIAIKHPAEVAELEALELLVAEADAIVQDARSNLKEVAGMDSWLFDQEVRPVEAAVWLVGSAEVPLVCLPQPDGSAEYRLATADRNQHREALSECVRLPRCL